MPHVPASRARTALAAAALAASLALTAGRADAAVTPTIQDRTLIVVGDATSEKLTLRVPATAPTTVEIDAGDDGSVDFRFPRAQFDLVRVRAGDGADRVRVDDAAIRGGATLPAILDGQGGADTLIGGRGSDTLIGGDGDDLAEGNGGSDSASLGAGNDQVAWDAGDGGDAVEGGAGFDRLALTGSAAADQIRFAADGIEVGPATLETTALERVDAAPRDGDDTLSVGDLTGTGVQELRLDLADATAATDRLVVDGSSGADFIDLLGSSAAQSHLLGLTPFITMQNSDPARDELRINGLAGNDRVDAGSAGAIKLTVDGGEGNDQLTGTNAVDTLTGGDGDDFVDGNRGNDVVLLGAGKDSARAQSGDGHDIVEGGAGADAVSFSGSAANERFGLASAGTRVRLSRDDAVAIDAGQIESFDVLSFGGADTVVAGDLSGTSVTAVSISLFDFAVPGGNTDVVTVDGTAGDDTINAAAASNVVTVSGLAAKLTISGATAVNDRLEVRGLAGADTVDSTGLPATAMRFLADGGVGDDVLLGGAGDDVFTGGDGADVVFAGHGDNVAFGGAGDDVLRGEEGDDVLDGGAGDDVLIGNAGDDVLLNGEVVFDD